MDERSLFAASIDIVLATAAPDHIEYGADGEATADHPADNHIELSERE